MVKQKIDRQLLPDIKINQSEKHFHYDGKDTPLEQAFNFIGKDKSLYLYASGGIGKTVSLRTFWLDFLSGKHDIPCIYVELKLLEARHKDTAIKQYILIQYKLDLGALNDGSTKPVLLVDAANEAHFSLLEKGTDKDSYLLKECKRLISDGFRLIISSRSSFIDRDGEFGASMEYCKLCGLTDDQRKIVISDESIDNTPLWDLLQNNMMLSIYLDLKSGETKINKETITAYGLLDSYFEECFLYRYVESSLNPGMWDKKNLHNRIKRQWNNAQHQDEYDEIIYIKLCKYKRIKEFLINNGFRDGFFENEINKGLDNPTLLMLAHLGILQRISNNSNTNETPGYVWGHEIYQEYFESIYLANQIREVLNNHYSFNEASRMFYKLGSLEYSEHDYRVIQYITEQVKFEKKDINYLYDLVETNESGDVRDNIIRIITLLSCFSADLGFPDKQTAVKNATFYKCRTLESIKIPDNITEIEPHAFRECTALKSIELPETIESIGEYSFSGCGALEDITFSKKLVFIGRAAFAGCPIKKIILPKGVRNIGSGAFDFSYSSEKSREFTGIFPSQYGVSDYSINVRMPSESDDNIIDVDMNLKEFTFSDSYGWMILFTPARRDYDCKWDKTTKKLKIYPKLFRPHVTEGAHRDEPKSFDSTIDDNMFVTVETVELKDDYSKCCRPSGLSRPTSCAWSPGVPYEHIPVKLFKVPSEELADPQTAAKFVARKYYNYQWIKIEKN